MPNLMPSGFLHLQGIVLILRCSSHLDNPGIDDSPLIARRALRRVHRLHCHPHDIRPIFTTFHCTRFHENTLLVHDEEVTTRIGVDNTGISVDHLGQRDPMQFKDVGQFACPADARGTQRRFYVDEDILLEWTRSGMLPVDFKTPVFLKSRQPIAMVRIACRPTLGILHFGAVPAYPPCLGFLCCRNILAVARSIRYHRAGLDILRLPFCIPTIV